MAKKSYIGIDGKARQVKKWYVGVDSKARKVKKGYIGVGGVARPFIGGGELAYYGAITSLSTARIPVSATVGNYALIAGGYASSYSIYSGLTAVDAYNSSLVRSTPTALASARSWLAGASTGNYALFAGGRNGATIYSSVEAYNSSLVKSTPSAMTHSLFGLAGASVGNNALFAGGVSGLASSTPESVVFAYNSSLTRSIVSSLSLALAGAVGITSTNYAIFGNGTTSNSSTSYSKSIDAYNTSLVKSTISSLSNTTRASGASVGGYALFAFSSATEAYNSSLVKSTTDGITSTNAAGASSKDFALFAGGNVETSSTSIYYTTYKFDANLVKSRATDLQTGRTYATGATIGNYMLIAGGTTSSAEATDSVEAYMVT